MRDTMLEEIPPVRPAQETQDVELDAIENEGGKRKFDPSRYLRDLKGNDYLDVKWRLVWLRSEHPDAIIRTELVKVDEKIGAIFKATIEIPGTGAVATGYGSEAPKDFGDFVEKAETKAIGRACGHLGYGTQFAGEDGDFAAPPRSSGSSSGGSRNSYSSSARSNYSRS